MGAPGSGVWYLGLGVELGISDSRDLSGHAKLKPRRLSLSTSKIDLLKKKGQSVRPHYFCTNGQLPSLYQLSTVIRALRATSANPQFRPSSTGDAPAKSSLVFLPARCYDTL